MGYTAPIQFERAAPRTETRKIFHTVQRGETLPGIAAKYKVSVEDLRRWNSIGRLFAGQKVAIEQAVAVSNWNRKATQGKPKKTATAGVRKASTPATKKKPQSTRG